MSWLTRRNVYVRIKCFPPFAWRWMPPAQPRFRRKRQESYDGYRDRTTGFYKMNHNKHEPTTLQDKLAELPPERREKIEARTAELVNEEK